MSYRRKKTAGIVLCYGIIHDGSGRLYRDKEQYWQCCFLGNRNKCRRNISTE